MYNQGMETCTIILQLDKLIFIMPVREQRRTPAFFPFIMHEYASSDSSASPRDLSGTAPIVTITANLTTDLDTSEAALYSPEDSMQGPDLACDPEQLEFLYTDQ